MNMRIVTTLFVVTEVLIKKINRLLGIIENARITREAVGLHRAR